MYITLQSLYTEFYVHVTNSFITKPTRRTNFSNLFWNENLHVSDSSSVHHQEIFTVHSAVVYVTQVCRQFLSRIPLESCLQICMTYTTAECTVNISWWWTEELSETCRVSFQNKFEKFVLLVVFIIRKHFTLLNTYNILHCSIHTTFYTAQYIHFTLLNTNNILHCSIHTTFYTAQYIHFTLLNTYNYWNIKTQYVKYINLLFIIIIHYLLIIFYIIKAVLRLYNYIHSINYWKHNGDASPVKQSANVV
jgi:hypothetical protein